MATVLITGAGSGLGRQMAIEFARLNYNLVLVSKTAKNLKETASLCSKYGVSVDYYTLDVSKYSQIISLKKKLDNGKIKIDILVNDAAIGFFDDMASLSVAEIEKMMHVNYFGSVYFAKIFLDDLVKIKGKIVFINSVAGKVFIPDFGAYGATKAALHFFAAALSSELKGKVAVISIYPAVMHTNLYSKAYFEKIKKRFTIYEPEWVAKKAVDAIIKNQKSVVIPSWLAPFLVLKRA